MNERQKREKGQNRTQDSNLEFLHKQYQCHSLIQGYFFMETPFPMGTLTGEANVEMSAGLFTK